MAHFAEIDENNIVVRVVVVPNYQENRGQDFLANDLGLGGIWIQCSYNNNMRKQYPGPGFTYDVEKDIFISPKPYNSWTLDENSDWQPPIPKPEGDYAWNEELLNWQLIDDINTIE